MSDIVAIGEPLFEFSQMPDAGQGTVYKQGFGGDTSNFACAAARVGARVAYLTRVGDDEFGHRLVELWRHENVDASASELDPEAPTGLYFISHGPAGHVFSYRRAGSAATRMRFTAEFREKVQAARFLHLSGVSQAVSAQACDTVFEAIDCARQHGVQVSYDLNFRPRLWSASRARAIAIETLRHTSLFLPSLDEAMDLFGLPDAAAVIDFAHRHGAARVALKRGRLGALVSDGDRVVEVPGIVVDSVDATGAGDCFGGVLVARLVAGDDLPAAAKAACVAAALSTCGFGAVEPLPDWAAISRRLSG